jgi:hypothetical protein
VSIGHFSPRAFAAAMSLTVTRPGRRPPYSGSDFSAARAIDDDGVIDDDGATDDDCVIDEDIVGTSKSLEAPLWRTRTLR